MKKFVTKNNTKDGLISGLIACGFILPLSLSFAAVTEQGLFAVVSCCAVCAIFSLFNKEKGGFLIPDIRVITIVLYMGAFLSTVEMYICMAIAGLSYLINKRINVRTNYPNETIVALSLGMVLSATVMLTNTYFGIGAHAETTKEMLKAFGNLGFHPNFMGLLTGTITLFTMITYPFKFKKLSKNISPMLVTLTIPFILNLFLNPDSNITNINESADIIFGNVTHPQEISVLQVLLIVSVGAILGDYIYVLNSDEKYSFGIANIFSFFPLRRIQENRKFNIISAITVIAIALAVVLLSPSLLTRIPMHSIGAMLIVYAWQSVPFSLFKGAFSQKGKFISVIISVALFFILSPLLAAIICLCIPIFIEEWRKKK